LYVFIKKRKIIEKGDRTQKISSIKKERGYWMKTIRDLISALELQNSLDNMYCIEQIRDEADLEKMQQQGYDVAYTKTTWEEDFPEIPCKYVFCGKGIVGAQGLSYLDIEHGIWIPLHIYGKENLWSGLNKKKFEKEILSQISVNMKLYEKKDYVSLLYGCISEHTGNITLSILSYLLEHEEPCENLYQAFLVLYTLSETGVEKISNKAIKNLFMSKSKVQWAATQQRLSDFEEDVYVYRGQGENSAPEDKAMSWSIEKSVAVTFALNDETTAAKVLTGVVKKKDILEYTMERNEYEVIVKPGTVEVLKEESIISFGEYGKYVRGIEGLVMFTGKERKRYIEKYFPLRLVRRVFSLYEKFGRGSDCHDAMHSCRVALHASALFTMYELKSWSFSGSAIFSAFADVVDAAVYHDIGRNTDGEDDTHGERSYLIYKKVVGENRVVKFLIENHCKDDETAKSILESTFKNKKKRQQVWGLYTVMKDADALDRVRFRRISSDYIRFKYLHNPDTILLMGVARKLLKEDFQTWCEN